MNLNQIYQKSVLNIPDGIAVIIDDQKCSFSELNQNIQKYTQALVNIGIKEGDKVGLFMPNSLEIIYLYFACFKIGAVAVPSSYYSKTKELIYEANHCGVKIYIVHDMLINNMVGVKDEVKSLEQIYVIHPENCIDFPSFDDELEKVDDIVAIREFSANEKTPGVIFYTSGSTGRPKGVTHTQYSLINAALNRCTTLRHDNSSIFFTTSYLCHGAAPTIALFPMLYAGGTACFMSHFSVEEFFDVIITHKPNYIAAGPSQYRELIDSKLLEDKDLSFLSFATSGGSAVPQKLQDDFEKLTNVPLTASMGMTEIGGYITTSPWDKRVRGSLGKAIHETEVIIVDIDGNQVENNEIGEIIVKSNSLFQGYWNDSEHTENLFTDGWFHTGDLGKIDDDGFVYFMGRLKETIIVDSGNVSPGEVEIILNEHPSVKQSVVVGVPDEVTDQAVFAFVELNSGYFYIDDLKKHAEQYLSERKVPKYWELIDNMSGSGIMNKINRKELSLKAAEIVKSKY